MHCWNSGLEKVPESSEKLQELHGWIQETPEPNGQTGSMIFNFVKKLIGATTTSLAGNTKMVFVVRTDLNMKCGKIAAQCAHGAVSLYNSASRSSNGYVNLWLLQGQPKIVLRLDRNCEESLNEIYRVAKSKGLNTCLLYDAGKTQVKPRTLTLVGIGPNDSKDVDEITKHLKLLWSSYC